jgi:hypothetical protein
MVHHSLTADGATVSWPAIRRFHVETNGWTDIGYHFGVERVADLGGFSIEALVGRPVTEHAAACPQGGMNSLAFHVCVVGNFDDAEPGDDVLRVLADRIVRPLMREHGIPAENIVGHHDYNPAKTCPGTKFDLERLRRLVR